MLLEALHKKLGHNARKELLYGDDFSLRPQKED